MSPSGDTKGVNMKLNKIIKYLLVCVTVMNSVPVLAKKMGLTDKKTFNEKSIKYEFQSNLASKSIAACFQRDGNFLPFSRFEPAIDTSGYLYSLAGFGEFFEEAKIYPNANQNGSIVYISHSPNYNKRWLQEFTKNRLEPLKNCLAKN